MDTLDRLIWKVDLFISALVHSIVNLDPTAIQWAIATTSADEWILIVVGLLALLLAFSAAVALVCLTLTGAIPVGQALYATYGLKGAAWYAGLWIVAFPVMLLVSLVLGFIFDWQVRNMRLGNPQIDALCRRLVENRKHEAHIATSRRADPLP